MKYLKNNGLSILAKSFLAGILIAIGGTIFLSCQNKVIGSIFFAIGLFTIVVYGFNLYTGKIGYLLENKPTYLIELGLTLIGNFIGTFFTSFILQFTRIIDSINIVAETIVTIKLNDSLISILILSFFCGILMYLAVNGYKTIDNYLGKVLAVFFGVIVFILCGFEHSIANMFYISISNMWSLNAILYILIMIFGNSLGGIFIPMVSKLIKK